MRLVEFLICILEAQAQTLQRLVALFGEEVVLHLLETAGETSENDPLPRVKATWFEATSGHDLPPAYKELEWAVREFKLPAVLEFHLWAYPFYRAFIESAHDLNEKIRGPGGNEGTELVEEAVSFAEGWIRKLPISPEFSLQAERATHVPWLRFRASVLKRVGKRPLGPVY